jgi:tetratricopeptide (TPR) repeat protein
MYCGQELFLLLKVLSCTVSIYALEALWKKLNSKACMLYQQGRYGEASKVAEEAFTVAEKTFGRDSAYTATSLSNLVELYRVQGRYAEAEPLHKVALTIVEKALGKNQPHVIITCENMAELYKQIGKKDEAERLEARARRIRSNQ